MSNGKKPVLRHLLVHGVVLLTMAASKVAAAVVPFWHTEDLVSPESWNDVGRQLSGVQTAEGLNQDVIDLVRTPTYGADLETVIRLTYAMSRASDFGELDDLWVRTLMSRSGSDTVASFLTVRSGILAQIPAAAGGKRFGDSWLWQAKGGGGGKGDS